MIRAEMRMSCMQNSSIRGRRHRIRLVFLSTLLAAISVACSSLEPYRLPENIGEIGTLEDEEPRFGSRHYVRVMSIDRKRIDSGSRGVASVAPDDTINGTGDSKDWIPMRTGLRKLEVQACKYSPSLLDALSWSGWYCGHTVLPLTVEAGAHYRLHGSVNKQEDCAELWIEDAESGKTVVGIIRVPIEN